MASGNDPASLDPQLTSLVPVGLGDGEAEDEVLTPSASAATRPPEYDSASSTNWTSDSRPYDAFSVPV